MKERMAASFPGFVYVLEDPNEPGHWRYVGITQALPSRFSTHCQRARAGEKTALYDWWRKLNSEGRTPRMRVLWQGSFQKLGKAEVYVIKCSARLGFKLLNEVKGGSGWKGHF